MDNEMKKFEVLLDKIAELLTETVEYADRQGVVQTRNVRGQYLQKVLGGIHYNLEAAIDWLDADPKNQWNLHRLREKASLAFERKNGGEIAVRQQQETMARVADQIELISFGNALKAVARDVYVEKTGVEPFPYRPLYQRTVNQDVGETDLMKQAKALGIKVGNVAEDYVSAGGGGEQRVPVEQLPDPTGGGRVRTDAQKLAQAERQRIDRAEQKAAREAAKLAERMAG